jgi:phosphoribosyl 1,2-cyclic phosphodiesterase
VQCGDRWFIFDAGSGLRALGAHLLEQGVQKASLLFSHFHWDHIQGFPFFAAAYQPSFQLDLYAGNLYLSQSNIQKALAGQMASPYFPVSPDVFKASIQHHDFQAGVRLEFDDGISAKTFMLNHPQGSTAYRLEHDGRSVCYVTDVEHQPGRLDDALVRFLKGADLVIYDCTYSDENFLQHLGWGHSTWQEGVRLCQAANAKQLAIFHHDPENTDTAMDTITARASALWSGAFVAREGQVLTLAR